ncbi:RibD family protein [Haliangium sp.]|uniref:RibD family protein n=1 Tax=Haliangium sp. TaxID=2663208 RepID=UPI003D0F6F0F
MLTETLAWRAVLALDRLIARSSAAGEPVGPWFSISPAGANALAADADASADAEPATVLVRADEAVGTRAWAARGPVADEAAQVFDLYLPMVLDPVRAPARARPWVIAHLAQSLDGRIATAGGTSQWISGALDQAHNHRMRALCDAVLVGAETVIHDDPQLTCREVEGEHPVRVVVDPRRRVEMDRRIFTDATAPTVIISGAAGPDQAGPEGALPDHVSRLELAGSGDSDDSPRISPHDILAALAALEVRRVFVEGGGVTVSTFLREHLLDRLQLTVAPVLIGSGRASITLPDIESLSQAMRPRVRRFSFGPDIMFECVFDESAP